MANRTEKCAGSTIRCLCPVALSSTQQEVGLDSWSTGRHSALTSLQLQDHRPSFSKDGTFLPFLVKHCVLSQESGMPPSLPSYPDLTAHPGCWFPSLEFLPTLGRLCVPWALRAMPLLSASSLSQVQPDGIDPTLDSFQTSCIFSFLIFKNYFSFFQWVLKGKVGPAALSLPS